MDARRSRDSARSKAMHVHADARPTFRDRSASWPCEPYLVRWLLGTWIQVRTGSRRNWSRPGPGGRIAPRHRVFIAAKIPALILARSAIAFYLRWIGGSVGRC